MDPVSIYKLMFDSQSQVIVLFANFWAYIGCPVSTWSKEYCVTFFRSKDDILS